MEVKIGVTDSPRELVFNSAQTPDELEKLVTAALGKGSELLALTVEFLQQAHTLKLDFSPRDGINILRYAIKRLASQKGHPLNRDKIWREAIERCLGDEALDLQNLAQRKSSSLGGNAVPLGLGDFFFDPEDPLHPDQEENEED